jgi:glycine/D-amino acid oxidase-like deaminating enzyme/nitrite reductase/ring-hydroxylating ferredoxin subunit
MAGTDSGRTLSSWRAEVPPRPLAPLDADTATDVCVIGAGITGLTTAYLLGREGRSTLVLDDGPIGGGQSARTTAHLSNALDDRYVELEKLHGPEGAALAAASHAAAIDLIERTAREERIDCEFTRLPGYLFAPTDSEGRTIEQEWGAAQRIGLTGVLRLPHAPVPGTPTGPCLRFPDQAQFQPLRYLEGLASAIERAGNRVHTGCHADSIEAAHGGILEVRTSAGRTVRARHVVVATNSPIKGSVTIHTKQAPYTTYVVALPIPAGALENALYWDTLDPYHYVRLHRGGAGAPGVPDGMDLLVVGGEDHKTGQSNDHETRYERLADWARTRFDVADPPAFRWSGQVMETIDGLAFIGPDPGGRDRVYIATGDSGHGMTHGTIAGLLLTDVIQGRTSPWADLYSPSRKRPRSIGEFVKENLNVAAQYTDWLTSGEFHDAAQVPAGGGAVLRRGLAKVAVHRDTDGRLHELSAVCPHLGCVVAWNDGEKSWDCPCHGSRFAATGEVVNGPANTGLAPAGD